MRTTSFLYKAMLGAALALGASSMPPAAAQTDALAIGHPHMAQPRTGNDGLPATGDDTPAGHGLWIKPTPGAGRDTQRERPLPGTCWCQHRQDIPPAPPTELQQEEARWLEQLKEALDRLPARTYCACPTPCAP